MKKPLEWKTCFKVGLSIFVLYLCIHYWGNISGILFALLGAALPLLGGCIVAYLVNILMSLYEKIYFPKSTKKFVTKSRRGVCMLFAFVTLFAIIFVVIYIVAPQLVECLGMILAKVPTLISKVVAFMQENHILPDDILASISAIDWSTRLEQIISTVLSGVGDLAGFLLSAVSSVFSAVVSALISFIFAIYLLFGKEHLAARYHEITHHYFSEKVCEKSNYFWSVMNSSFRGYVVGQCIEAVVIGVLCLAGMLILGLPYAAMISALIAVTALIPVAGAYIGAITGAVLIFTISPIKAIIFVVFIVILQQLETNLIYPRVVGSSMGLPGIWVLAAVTVGGGVLGIVGLLLSVPLVAAIYRFINDDLAKETQPVVEPKPPTEPVPEPVPAPKPNKKKKGKN